MGCPDFERERGLAQGIDCRGAPEVVLAAAQRVHEQRNELLVAQEAEPFETGSPDDFVPARLPEPLRQRRRSRCRSRRPERAVRGGTHERRLVALEEPFEGQRGGLVLAERAESLGDRGPRPRLAKVERGDERLPGLRPARFSEGLRDLHLAHPGGLAGQASRERGHGRVGCRLSELLRRLDAAEQVLVLLELVCEAGVGPPEVDPDEREPALPGADPAGIVGQVPDEPVLGLAHVEGPLDERRLAAGEVDAAGESEAEGPVLGPFLRLADVDA